MAAVSTYEEYTMTRILLLAMMLAFTFPVIASDSDAEKAAEAATEEAKEATKEAAAEGEKAAGDKKKKAEGEEDCE